MKVRAKWHRKMPPAPVTIHYDQAIPAKVFKTEWKPRSRAQARVKVRKVGSK